MKIYHIHSEFTNMDHARFSVARKTWDMLDTVKVGVHDSEIGFLYDDVYRKVPYFKNIIDMGIEKINTLENYIILFTNADSCLLPSIIDSISSVNNEFSNVYDRIDIPYIFDSPLESGDLDISNTFAGKDAFAFTKDFWISNREKLTDTLFASEFWDYIFYIELKIYSKNVNYISGQLYHQQHYQKWMDPKFKTTLPSQIHNIKLARDFLRKNIEHVDLPTHMQEWEETIFKLV